MASSHGVDCDAVQFQLNKVLIIVKAGDLLSEKDIDAIVIPTPDPNNQNPEQFFIYKKILDEANSLEKDQIRKKCRELESLRPIFFEGRHRKFILTMVPFYGSQVSACKYLKRTYSSCVTLAARKNLRRIAFPTIGCGVIGFPVKEAAESAFHGLKYSCESNDGKDMKEIRMIVYNSKIYSDFKTSIINLAQGQLISVKNTPTSTNTPILSEPTSSSSRNTNSRMSQHSSMGASNDRHANADDESLQHQRDGNPRTSDTRLNPDASEFRPIGHSQNSMKCRFRLGKANAELIISKGNILNESVDAIVNATDETMTKGCDVDGSINKVAGRMFRLACERHKEIYKNIRLPTGRSRILLSYDLFKDIFYIINTAEPAFNKSEPEQFKRQLASCYRTSMNLAVLYDLVSIAFTAVGCNKSEHPVDIAAEIALKTVEENIGSLRRVSFILPEDDLYYTWLKKAEQLGYTPLDPIPGNASNSLAPRQTTASNASGGSQSSKSTDNQKSAIPRSVIDASTPDNASEKRPTSGSKSTKTKGKPNDDVRDKTNKGSNKDTKRKT